MNQPSVAQDLGPAADSAPELMQLRSPGSIDVDRVWTSPPSGVSIRGTGGPYTWDNGLPLDDFGDPASQLSEAPAPPAFRFNPAAADDFIINDAMNPSLSVRITTVRVAITFFGTNSAAATPSTTWNSVIVTIYPNVSMSGDDDPGGQPDTMGGHTGSVVANQEVLASMLLSETLGGVCRPYFIVDIPVDLVVQKNTKYWLSVVPRFPAPPQTAWCISQANTNDIAQRGFPTPFGIPFWTDIPGNANHASCAAQNPPPAGTLKNLSFVLFAEEIGPTGACCLDDGTCQEVSESTCTGMNGSYQGDATLCTPSPCPPAGACCLNDGTCEILIESACTTANGTYQGDATTCSPSPCPLAGACCLNDGTCEILIPSACTSAGGTYQGDETSCSPNPCPPVGACCMTVGSCDIQTESACTTASGTYQGDGTICTPNPCPVMGACCLSGGNCQVLTETDCTTMSGTYQGDGAGCTPNPCPAPGGPECCLGDINNNCDLEETDIPGFVDALLDPPLIGTPEFCRADVNEDDVVDGLDVALFVEKLLAGQSCTPTCCPGDTNGDGLLDGLDVQGLVNAVLSPPPCGSLAFCRADVDEDDAITLLDVDALSNKLVVGDVCPP